jgi:hypothetical protein
MYLSIPLRYQIGLIEYVYISPPTQMYVILIPTTVEFLKCQIYDVIIYTETRCSALAFLRLTLQKLKSQRCDNVLHSQCYRTPRVVKVDKFEQR